MIIRQAGCPNRNPGVTAKLNTKIPCTEIGAGELKLLCLSMVVGNVGIRNMFYHTNFGGGRMSPFPQVTAKNDPPESSR